MHRCCRKRIHKQQTHPLFCLTCEFLAGLVVLDPGDLPAAGGAFLGGAFLVGAVFFPVRVLAMVADGKGSGG